MQPHITIIGSANVDFIMKVSHLPVRGETVADATFFQAFGGKGANQAVAAARAGGAVALVGALGSDPLAHSYLKALRADGIRTEQVSLEDDIAGGSALVMVDEQGDNYLSVAPGANSRVTPERIEAAEGLIASSDWVVLQQEIPWESNKNVLKLAARHHTAVLLNYAPAHDLRLRPDAAVHGLVVNEIEAAALVGQPWYEPDLESAGTVAAELQDVGGHRFVVITLGKTGVAFADRTGVNRAPAFQVDAVDTTAAGDTFCGALAVALGEEQCLADAVRFASAASALSVTKVGAQSSIPTRADIDRFMNEPGN